MTPMTLTVDPDSERTATAGSGAVLRPLIELMRRVRSAARPAVAARPAPADFEATALDLAMMRRAIALAEAAAKEGEVPVGAVVYRGEEILAEAANNRETTQDPVGHAELLAMSEAGRRLGEWRLSDCSLAVTLEPCPMCAGAMVNARLGRVLYGAADPKAGACHTLFRIPVDHRLNHAVQMRGGVLADECGELLRSFFRARREARKQARTKGACACDPARA